MYQTLDTWTLWRIPIHGESVLVNPIHPRQRRMPLFLIPVNRVFLKVIIDTDAAAAFAAAAASGFTTVFTVVSQEAAAKAAAASVSIITSINTRLTGIEKTGILFSDVFGRF